MNHKTEAEKLLYRAYNDPPDSEGFFEVQAALAEATLALVEAQEAANEQARIANLIALATSNVHEVVGDYSLDPALEALMQLVTTFPTGVDDEVFGFAPEIARALRIEVAE